MDECQQYAHETLARRGLPAIAFFFWHGSAIYSPQAWRIKSQRIAAGMAGSEGLQRIRGASPVPFASFQKLTWIDRGGY